MDDEEFPSDSEQSDEDYCPDELQGENLSEVDSDDNVDDVDTHENESKSTKKRKKGKQSTKKQTVDNVANEVENVATKSTVEDPEDEKLRADALWADFLKDTDPLPTKKSTESKTTSTVVETSVRDDVQPEVEKKEVPKKMVTQTFDFAGEKVEITKEITVDPPDTTNEKAESKSSGPSNGIGRRPPFVGMKRSGGGIGSVLGQITKKNKISVLDKSKHDWDSFKRTEGIDEELQTHNRGKDGYLERQDFLDRTDVRQFELEKSIRLSKRNNRNY